METETGQGFNPSEHIAAWMFTDIVDSTHWKDVISDPAYMRLLERHNFYFETLIKAFNGAQIIKHTGDGYMAAFKTAAHAVDFALRFQRAMSDENWQRLLTDIELPGSLQTRVGIHLGQGNEVWQAGKRDYVGLAVDTTARAMSKALPNQILITWPVYESARHRIPPRAGRVVYIKHGPYMLKGVGSLELFEVGQPGVAPLKSPPDGTTSLPERAKPRWFKDRRVGAAIMIIGAAVGIWLDWPRGNKDHALPSNPIPVPVLTPNPGPAPNPIPIPNPTPNIHVAIHDLNNRPAWRAGDLMRFEVTIDQPCYLTMIARDSNGDYTLLLPNGFSLPQMPAEPSIVEIPGRFAKYQFVCQRPFGPTVVQVIATRRPLRLKGVTEQRLFDERYVSGGQAGFTLETDQPAAPAKGLIQSLKDDLDPGDWGATEMIVNTEQ